MTKQEAKGWLISILMRLLGWTLRMQLIDEDGYFDPARKTRRIAGAWHNRILVLPLFFDRYRNRPHQRLTVMTSGSRDGRLLAATVKHFAMEVVHGSSSRGGANAMRELRTALESGSDVVISPDGPRGPRYTVGRGIVFLAQSMNLPVFQADAEYSSYWELKKSWDHFRIPKPFSKVIVRLKMAEYLAQGDDAVLEAECARLEAKWSPTRGEDVKE